MLSSRTTNLDELPQCWPQKSPPAKEIVTPCWGGLLVFPANFPVELAHATNRLSGHKSHTCLHLLNHCLPISGGGSHFTPFPIVRGHPTVTDSHRETKSARGQGWKHRLGRHRYRLRRRLRGWRWVARTDHQVTSSTLWSRLINWGLTNKRCEESWEGRGHGQPRRSPGATKTLKWQVDTRFACR